MIGAIEEAISFSNGKSRRDLSSNRMLVLSLMKEMEIIGEATSKISNEVKLRYPEIPWIDIIGLRNRLMHGYFEVDLEILWNTIIKDLPPLKK